MACPRHWGLPSRTGRRCTCPPSSLPLRERTDSGPAVPACVYDTIHCTAHAVEHVNVGFFSVYVFCFFTGGTHTITHTHTNTQTNTRARAHTHKHARARAHTQHTTPRMEEDGNRLYCQVPFNKEWETKYCSKRATHRPVAGERIHQPSTSVRLLTRAWQKRAW